MEVVRRGSAIPLWVRNFEIMSTKDCTRPYCYPCGLSLHNVCNSSVYNMAHPLRDNFLSTCHVAHLMCRVRVWRNFPMKSRRQVSEVRDHRAAKSGPTRRNPTPPYAVLGLHVIDISVCYHPRPPSAPITTLCTGCERNLNHGR